MRVVEEDLVQGVDLGVDWGGRREKEVYEMAGVDNHSMSLVGSQQRNAGHCIREGGKTVGGCIAEAGNTEVGIEHLEDRKMGVGKAVGRLW